MSTPLRSRLVNLATLVAAAVNARSRSGSDQRCVRGVAAVQQTLDIRWNLSRQRAIEEPSSQQGTDRRDLGHDGLLLSNRPCCPSGKFLSSALHRRSVDRPNLRSLAAYAIPNFSSPTPGAILPDGATIVLTA